MKYLLGELYGKNGYKKKLNFGQKKGQFRG
jgi:hypothetical protein